MRMFNYLALTCVIFAAERSYAERFTLEQDGTTLIVQCNEPCDQDRVIEEVKVFHKSISKKGSAINKEAHIIGNLGPSPRPGKISFAKFFKANQYRDAEALKNLKAHLEERVPRRRSSSGSINRVLEELTSGSDGKPYSGPDLAAKLLQLVANEADGGDRVLNKME